MSDQPRPMSSADDQHLAAVLRRLIATGYANLLSVSLDEERGGAAVFEAGRRL